MNDVPVLLLAAGMSSRFWPLPHKMQMRFMGKSFLEHQIELLQKAGFKRIILVGNEEINQSVGNIPVKKVMQVGVGQAAGVLSARKHITGKDVLIINADDYVSVSLLQQIRSRLPIKHNLIIGYETRSYFPGGYLVLDGKRVVGIHEKPGVGKEPSSFVKLVCDYFTNADTLLSSLEHEQSESDDLYEKAVTGLMHKGELFELIEYAGEWIPIKFPWHTLDLMNYYLMQLTKSHAHKSVEIHKSVSISGTVVLDKNVRVLEYAKLVGPLYVGEGTIIGNHTLVRSSMIGKNCVVGFGSDVTRSYLGDMVWLHTNYVGDSIVASNVAMGSGTTLANLRLDEGEISSYIQLEKLNTGKTKLGAIIGENTRIGVGTYTMPGVKIGSNSIVGAGVVLSEDLPNNKRCFLKQSHMISDNTFQVSSTRDKYKQKI